MYKWQQLLDVFPYFRGAFHFYNLISSHLTKDISVHNHQALIAALDADINKAMEGVPLLSALKKLKDLIRLNSEFDDEIEKVNSDIFEEFKKFVQDDLKISTNTNLESDGETKEEKPGPFTQQSTALTLPPASAPDLDSPEAQLHTLLLPHIGVPPLVQIILEYARQSILWFVDLGLTSDELDTLEENIKELTSPEEKQSVISKLFKPKEVNALVRRDPSKPPIQHTYYGCLSSEKQHFFNRSFKKGYTCIFEIALDFGTSLLDEIVILMNLREIPSRKDSKNIIAIHFPQPKSKMDSDPRASYPISRISGASFSYVLTIDQKLTSLSYLFEFCYQHNEAFITKQHYKDAINFLYKISTLVPDSARLIQSIDHHISHTAYQDQNICKQDRRRSIEIKSDILKFIASEQTAYQGYLKTGDTSLNLPADYMSASLQTAEQIAGAIVESQVANSATAQKTDKQTAITQLLNKHGILPAPIASIQSPPGSSAPQYRHSM